MSTNLRITLFGPKKMRWTNMKGAPEVQLQLTLTNIQCVIMFTMTGRLSYWNSTTTGICDLGHWQRGASGMLCSLVLRLWKCHKIVTLMAKTCWNCAKHLSKIEVCAYPCANCQHCLLLSCAMQCFAWFLCQSACPRGVVIYAAQVVIIWIQCQSLSVWPNYYLYFGNVNSLDL